MTLEYGMLVADIGDFLSWIEALTEAAFECGIFVPEDIVFLESS